MSCAALELLLSLSVPKFLFYGKLSKANNSTSTRGYVRITCVKICKSLRTKQHEVRYMKVFAITVKPCPRREGYKGEPD